MEANDANFPVYVSLCHFYVIFMLFFLIGIGIIGAEPLPRGEFRPHLVSAPPAP